MPIMLAVVEVPESPLREIKPPPVTVLPQTSTSDIDWASPTTIPPDPPPPEVIVFLLMKRSDCCIVHAKSTEVVEVADDVSITFRIIATLVPEVNVAPASQ